METGDASHLDEDERSRRHVHDLAALREAERALANSERRFEALVEHLPAGVIQFSVEGEIVLANREARRILDLNEQPKGHYRAWEGLAFEADGSPCEVADFPVVRCLEERKPQPQRLLGVLRPDGTHSWALYSATPLFDGEQFAGALAVFPDVAARKQAEDQLEQAHALSERIFHILADQSSDAIFRADASGDCTYVNARWREQTGLTLDDSLGAGWVAALHPDDREWVSNHWRETFARADDWRGQEFRLVDPLGRVTWVRGTASPIHDANGALQGYIGINQDITAQRLAKQRESVMIEELNHRVKNAMATVVGLAALTSRNSESLGEFMSTFTGRIHSMARLHDALARQNWVDLSIEQIIHGALLGSQANVRFEGPPLTVSARVAMPLGQALFELNANAVRHGALALPDGRVELRWTPSSESHVQLDWSESGGPPIHALPSPGVGLTLLHGLLEQEIGGLLELHFERDGLHAHLRFPIR